MIRCRDCGTPVGRGKPLGGDTIICSNCAASLYKRDPRTILGTPQSVKREIFSQLHGRETARTQKAPGDWHK